jgi:hypothetical protein
MITKTISNISSDDYPWVMGNLAQAFTVESQTHNTITATGTETAWSDLNLPDTVTVTEA